MDVCGKVASKLYCITGKPKFIQGCPRCIDVTLGLPGVSYYYDIVNTVVQCGLVGHVGIIFGTGINPHGALLYNCSGDIQCYPGDDVENVMY